MRRILFFTIAFICFLGFVSCNNSSKKKDKKTDSLPNYKTQKDYRRLVGQVNNKKIVLHLIDYHTAATYSMDSNELVYSGTLLTKDVGAPMIISGYIGKDSLIQLVAYNQFTPKDTISGHFSENVFQGKITNREGESTPIKLSESYPKGSFYFGLASYEDSLLADTSVSKGLKATTDLMTIWPQKDMDSTAQKLITDTISQSFFGMNHTFNSPQKLLHAVSDSFLTHYQNSVSKLLKEFQDLRPNFSWNLLAYMNITCNANYTFSTIFTTYRYTGGAHGLQSEFGYAVNLKTGKTITLSDIFKPDYQDLLQKKLEQKFRKKYNLSTSEPLNGKNGLLFDKHLKISSNFYLTPYGIGFLYNPYEVAPYVVGIINLYIPFNKLDDILKK